MNTLIATNPALAFFSTKSVEVAAAREALRRRIEDVSPELGRTFHELLAGREATQGGPSLGETWVLFLADLVGASPTQVQPIRDAWLALYAYTIILDKHCDTEEKQNPRELLLGSLLYQMGLSDLARVSKGTPWAHTIEQSIQAAIEAQVSDVTEHSSQEQLIEKRKSAAGKNSGFVAGAAAVAALGVQHADALVGFANKILLALQHLDDIADFEDDYRASRYTYLLATTHPFLPLNPRSDTSRTSRMEILRALIRSHALEHVVAETRALLSDSASALKRALDPPVRPSAAMMFLDEMDSRLEELYVTVYAARENLKKEPISDEHADRIALGVERKLIVVAQQS